MTAFNSFPNIAVVYHSGYGHTRRMAEAVAEGAGAALHAIDAEGNLPETGWAALDAADASSSARDLHGRTELAVQEIRGRILEATVFREMAGQIFRRLYQQRQPLRRQLSTLQYFALLAWQHGGLWLSLGTKPSNTKASLREDANRMGSYLGPMAQSDADAAPEEMSVGYLETRRLYGAGVAGIVRALRV
ncbi:flavodoxin/nitric oxide synthase [Bradyrhizobium lupini HPC(L)]|uniref:Flavodoxin/nitric oxide synthase n=1 Tax=Bradyrhizobium lupini HPC(L) TaxID=1229491 RepID=A0ABP2RQ60_RHILU|nr:flavodoxin/nitric oxide synthase [Bradyrhizobium lupini HPC(L)]